MSCLIVEGNIYMQSNSEIIKFVLFLAFNEKPHPNVIPPNKIKHLTETQVHLSLCKCVCVCLCVHTPYVCVTLFEGDTPFGTLAQTVRARSQKGSAAQSGEKQSKVIIAS